MLPKGKLIISILAQVVGKKSGFREEKGKSRFAVQSAEEHLSKEVEDKGKICLDIL